MKRLLGLSIAAATLAAAAWAQAENSVLTCEPIGRNAVRQCALSPLELARPLFDELDQRYLETEFKVPYDFTCTPPAGFSVGLQIGGRYDQLTAGRGSWSISGRGVLRTFDPDPTLTRRWHFASPGGCTLVIDQATITARPTIGEIETWHGAADQQARIIDLGIDRYELAKDFDGYRSWALERLSIFSSEINGKIDYYRTLCDGGDQAACRARRHFIVIRNAVEAAIESSPGFPAPPPEQLTAEIQTVVDVYRAELVQDVERGEKMLARYATWSIEAKQSLADALALVPGDVPRN